VSNGFFHRLLGCRLVSIEFPNVTTCRLNLPSGNCTDMGGAIRVASAVTRNLAGFRLLVVETIANGDWERCTVYVRQDTKSPWQARRVSQ
jgi:hypothetical protein